MKKLQLVLALSVGFAVLSTLAFVNNLVAIVHWWQAFSAAGGDTSAIPAHAAGFIGWLDWTAVDYSSVTTFIPFLGAIFLVRSAWRMLRKRPMTADDFPFFRGSDQFNIALGLFGTLWGIIVIGYFKLDTVQMADLMQCLHTALFSTLMAVVWVFLLDRPLIRPYFVRLLKESQLETIERDDLVGAVEQLVTRLTSASAAFDARQQAYEAAFEKRQKEYEVAFANRQADEVAATLQRQEKADKVFAARLAEQGEAFAKAQAEMATRLAAYEKAFDARQKEYVEFFKREIAELEKRAAASEAKLAAVVSALKG